MRCRRAWTIGAVALACWATQARAAPASWEVFAGVRDTVVFFTADGAVIRAPFDLASSDTLWTPAPHRHLVRLSVSPDGSRIAWISRGFDADTTRLWVSGPDGTKLRLRYFALQPRLHDYAYSEPDVPTTQDVGVRGARFVQPSTRMRRHACNTLAWSSDSRTVVVGYDGGIAKMPADRGPGSALEELSPVRLEALHPSPMFLVDAILLRDTSRPRAPEQFDLEHVLNMNELKNAPSRAAYVLTTTPGGWHAYPFQGFTQRSIHAAGERTVWWADGRTVRAARAGDPEATVELTAADWIEWLGYDAARQALLWISEHQVGRKPVTGSDAGLIMESAAPIRSVLASENGRRIGIVSEDSLLVWNPADDSIAQLARADTEPCALFEGPGDSLYVALDCRRHAPRLARADLAAGRLVPIETPKVRGGVFHAIAGGAWILLYDPRPKGVRSIEAYDTTTGAWREVANPGVTGWEPLRTAD